MANARSIENTRDAVYARASTLTEKSAKKLFEEPFAGVLKELDEETRDELFYVAKEEVETLTKGEPSWPSVFNTYAELAELVTFIREPHAPEPEDALSELALQVFSAQNRITTLFYVLRTNKDITEAQGRNIIEAAFPIAVRGLSEDVRKAVFSYAYERNSGGGWGEVAEAYSKLAELVSRVKPDGITVVDSGA